MGGDKAFWGLFGGIWFVVGVSFVAATLGISLVADSAMVNEDAPLWLFFLLGFVFSGTGAAIIHVARAAAARDRRLTQFGKQITATVVDIRRSMIHINRQARWHVVYRYEDERGRALLGESRALPGEAVQAYRPGDRVNIKIDPQKPKESLLLGAV